MKRMLIVEDDVLTQWMLLRIFKDKFNVNIIGSIEEFIQSYEKTNFDVIIMDISIKGSKSGLELTKRLKADPFFSKTPIICLTAHALMKHRRLAMEAGVDLYLTKPISNNVLKEEVNKIITH